MSWEYMSNGKPQIYNIATDRNTGVEVSKRLIIPTDSHSQISVSSGMIEPSDVYYSWASGSIWTDWYAGLKYTNDTGQPVKINKLGIKTLSCHSGGQTFVSYSGGTYSYTGPAYGYGGDYCVFILVSNDGGTTFELLDNQSHYTQRNIANVTSSNMTSRGSISGQQTASFNPTPLNEYEINDCPTIMPNGIAYIMFGIRSFNEDDIYHTYIKCILNPSEMEVDMDQDDTPYIWQYCLDPDRRKRWHLVKRVLSRNSSGGWDIADDIGGFNTP